MKPTINYVADAARPSPFNQAIARVLLGTFILWKVPSLDWGEYTEWPFPLREQYAFLTYDAIELVIPFLPWVLVVTLLAFIIGYRTKWTGLASALLVIGLASYQSALYYSGQTEQMFIAAYLILFLSLFHEPDRISFDGVRKTAEWSLTEINEAIQSPDGPKHEYTLTGLTLSLIIVSIVYIGAAWGKVLVSGLSEWATSENLSRYILHYQEVGGVARPIGEFAVQYPELMLVGAWATIIFEVALLPLVVLKRDITLVVAGLIGLHLSIIVMFGLFFIGNIVFLLLFVAWDRLHAALSTDEGVDLVYDKHCYFCARSLYLFKLLDLNQTVTFHTQYTAPEEYRSREGVEFDDRMYVFADGEAYGGYDAFRRLFKQFAVTTPMSWVMALPPIAAVGKRVYAHIAANRNRYFVCSWEPETNE